MTVLTVLADGEDYLSRRGARVGSFSREPEEFTGDRRVLSFRIIDDDIAERPETFRVRLASTETGIFVSPERAEVSVVILDNDGGMSLTLKVVLYTISVRDSTLASTYFRV